MGFFLVYLSLGKILFPSLEGRAPRARHRRAPPFKYCHPERERGIPRRNLKAFMAGSLDFARDDDLSVHRIPGIKRLKMRPKPRRCGRSACTAWAYLISP